MANGSSIFKSLTATKTGRFTLSNNGTEGLTLLEIVITIALISIMTIPVMGNYFKTQQRARDAVRRQNISEISNALEEYYGICGFAYPAAGAYAGILGGGSITCAVPAATFMSKVPVDPKTNSAYTCNGCTSTAYQLCGVLEAEVAPTPTGFCLSNRQ